MRGDSAATGPPIDQAKAGQCLGFDSVAAGLKAVQPVLDIARFPSDLARADVAGTGKAAVAGAAIESGSGFEACDVEHVHDSQKLVSIRGHEGRPFHWLECRTWLREALEAIQFRIHGNSCMGSWRR